MLLIRKYPFKFIRKGKENKKFVKSVKRIIEDVYKRGDDAIVYWTKIFDCPDYKKEDIKVKELEGNIEKEMEILIKKVIERIENFAKAQLENTKTKIEKDNCSQIIIPVKRVGIYVPAGKAPLFSSLLMTAIPAKIAGVEEIYISTPPGKDKKISPYIIYCAKILGIKNIFAVGGAQAIAGMTFGTETIPEVDLIAGAGNKYVQTAKKILFGKVGIDTIAGPSEIVILADENSNPEFVAYDLISQAEHGEDSLAILITPSIKFGKTVRKYVSNILSQMPRKEIIQKALKRRGMIVIVDSFEEGIDLINEIAPEHLSIQIKEPDKIISKIRNAGSIFLGDFSPVAIGDYWAGPSHILPTGGTSRFLSHLGVRTFLKEVSIVNFDKKELLNAKDNIVILAEREGLLAHAESIKVRGKYAEKE